ncbi:hypothetical protein [Marinitoga lauensis]|uniref:hypothetical protein n=1 Tax=Marinitoga lauensis TaxID=2201189 RepID=UPI001010E50B|nr:hypothetical protein [Marinitoga lauensis]
MNKLYNLLLENIKTLKLIDIEFKITIDNEVYENIITNKKERIRIQYKGEHYVEIVFFENIDYIFLLSLDSIIKDFCSIKKKKILMKRY